MMLYIKINQLLNHVIKRFGFNENNGIYIVLKLNKKMKRTITLHDINKEWNEEFIFEYTNPKKYDHITIEYYQETTYLKTFMFGEKIRVNLGPIARLNTEYLKIKMGILYFEELNSIKQKDITIDNRDNLIKHKNSVIEHLSKKNKIYENTISNMTNIIEDYKTREKNKNKNEKEKENYKENSIHLKTTDIKYNINSIINKLNSVYNKI